MIPVVDGEIIITRRIMLNGKSTIKINDETVSATTMRKIATRLINIHGQHDGEILLEKNKHLSILDDFGQDSLNDIMVEVKELYDESVDAKIREEIAKDHYKEDGPVKMDDDKELFYDYFSERYFESTKMDVLQAEAGLNKIIATECGAYLNEFYKLLGLEGTKAGKELGWSNGILESMYWTNWVDFDHKKVEMEDGMECTIITMMQEPVIDFAYY
jgi:hypothetical protein